MIVERAAVLGRCMGVRRAVDLALKTAEAEKKGAGRPVYTLGPLIHNPQAVAKLEMHGIRAIENGAEAAPGGAVVIIRAHGVPPGLRAQLEAQGAEIVDATCPRVIASQRKAEDCARQGCQVIIAGDPGHGEVAGIKGFAEKGASEAEKPNRIAVSVVSSASEAERIELSPPFALLAQTTIKEDEYEAIRRVISARAGDTAGEDTTGDGARAGNMYLDTICPATAERLASLRELARNCDAIVVVGGRNSANTARLFNTARELGRPSWLVETAAELPSGIFSFDRVGITAGASSPDDIVDAVAAALQEGRS